MLGEKALGQLGEMRGCVFVGQKQAYELADSAMRLIVLDSRYGDETPKRLAQRRCTRLPVP